MTGQDAAQLLQADVDTYKKGNTHEHSINSALGVLTLGEWLRQVYSLMFPLKEVGYLSTNFCFRSKQNILEMIYHLICK